MTEPVKHDATALSLLSLGLLSDREARTVEAHLAHCGDCCRELQQLRAALELIDENVPPEMWTTDRADPDDVIISRALRTARTIKRSEASHRLLRLVAAAAVVVMVALSGGFIAGRLTATDTAVAVVASGPARTIVGSGLNGAAVLATIAPAPSGDTVQLSVSATGLPRGSRCQLVVVTAAGRHELAGSWTVPQASAAPGNAIHGSAAVNIGQVRAVAVTDADTGQQLAYLQV